MFALSRLRIKRVLGAEGVKKTNKWKNKTQRGGNEDRRWEVHRRQGSEQDQRQMGRERRPAWRWAGLMAINSQQHARHKFGVTATAYPKCQHLHVALA